MSASVITFNLASSVGLCPAICQKSKNATLFSFVTQSYIALGLLTLQSPMAILYLLDLFRDHHAPKFFYLTSHEKFHGFSFIHFSFLKGFYLVFYYND